MTHVHAVDGYAAAGVVEPAPAANAGLRGAARALLQSTCSTNDLPSLPSNAAWTSANNCNQARAPVAQGASCTATCITGFRASGTCSYGCFAQVIGDGRAAGGVTPQAMIWDGSCSLTCTGAVHLFRSGRLQLSRTGCCM
jgi:hypothetical protein